ncbi:uncharacterized protein LOC142659795 [Rhinoderma darwinii]|uniref:uncharacterized protein LOC142659795 n=1 Tax=Rhinoderma darwinii TaxID=43563 RepID=UPI003F6815DB
MSSSSFPHTSCPSSSDLSEFPSFSVINDTSISSHESVSIATTSDSSSASTLNSSSMAPQDYSSSSELDSSSMSPLNFPSQTECSSSTYSQNSSLRSQAACSPISLQSCSSIPYYTHSTLIPTYSSKSQNEYSSSLFLNGTSTFQTFSHPSSMNCSSTSQPALSTSKSCLEASPTSCQTSTSISQMTYSSLSLQNCEPISEYARSSISIQNFASESQSEHSYMSQSNGTTTSRTNDHSISPLNSSSCYFVPPTKDPSDLSPISIFDSSTFSVHGCSSTSTLNCWPANQHAKTTQEYNNKLLSDNSYLSPSLDYSISSINIPCICTCESTTDFPPGIPSSHLSSHHPCCSTVKDHNLISSTVDCSSLNHSDFLGPNESSYTSQSQNILEFDPEEISQPDVSDKQHINNGRLHLSNNITPINNITCPSMTTTSHPCGPFISTNHAATNVDSFTPCSTQNFQSQTFPENDVVFTNDEISVDHLLVNGEYSYHLPTKCICSLSLPNSVDSSANTKVLNSPSSNTPTLDSTCPNSLDQTVFTNISEKRLKMLPRCPHASTSGVSPMDVPIHEEGNQVQECEVCKASVENKVRMDQDRQLCEHFLDSLSRFEDWLQIAQITTSQGNPFKTLHQEAKLALRKYEVLLTEMREKLLDLESLNRQYWRLTQTPLQTLLPSVLRSRMQEVNTLWDGLQGEAETLHRTFKSRVQQREEFETDQDDMKLCLTEMNLELSNVEYIYGGNSTEKIQQLKAFQEDVWSNMKKVEGLLERGDQLIDSSDPRDAADLEVEMTELGSYCQQIYIRLSRLQKRLVSTKLVFEDDFLDGAVEHLSSGSSDVFLDLEIEDGEVPIPVPVPFTNAALPVDLEWDPLGDVGRSSSHDGQESFYTATSATWKFPQKSEGSQSSLSSYSGITISNLRRQEVKEPLKDVHTNLTPPQDNCHLEWTQEQIRGQEHMEHTLALQLETDMGQDIILCCDEPHTEDRIDNHIAFHGYSNTANTQSPLTSHEDVIDSQSQPNCSGQRRRQRKKKRLTRNQDAKGTLKPTKPDVTILMENGDDLSHLDLQKTSNRPSCSFCLWIRRLAFASLLLLVLVTSLLIPWGRQTFPSKRFSWSLMLTYVNGPPPT